MSVTCRKMSLNHCGPSPKNSEKPAPRTIASGPVAPPLIISSSHSVPGCVCLCVAYTAPPSSAIVCLSCMRRVECRSFSLFRGSDTTRARRAMRIYVHMKCTHILCCIRAHNTHGHVCLYVYVCVLWRVHRVQTYFGANMRLVGPRDIHSSHMAFACNAERRNATVDRTKASTASRIRCTCGGLLDGVGTNLRLAKKRALGKRTRGACAFTSL